MKKYIFILLILTMFVVGCSSMNQVDMRISEPSYHVYYDLYPNESHVENSK